jgi:uncharacterized protein YjbJ (UPF0337 family)
MVDENRVSGSAKQMGGSAKETAGDLTGDQKLKNEGMMDKAKGKIENAVGSAKDAVKETFGSGSDQPDKNKA